MTSSLAEKMAARVGLSLADLQAGALVTESSGSTMDTTWTILTQLSGHYVLARCGWCGVEKKVLRRNIERGLSRGCRKCSDARRVKTKDTANVERQTRLQGECLIWTGGQKEGYGVICVDRKRVLVHRLVLERKLGRDLQPGECACHSCDTPLCVNPEHLWLGTHQENMDDRERKGRGVPPPRPKNEQMPRGERNNKAKLTEEKVRELRQLFLKGWACSALARRYGISYPAAKDVIDRKHWAHVS